MNRQMQAMGSSRLRPLLSTPWWTLAADGLSIVATDPELHQERALAEIPVRGWRRSAARSRLGRRALRAEPSDAVALDHGLALINHRDTIFALDLERNALTVDFQIPQARRSLRLMVLPSAGGERADVYFGDYMSNPGREPANVWRRDGRSGTWNCVHTFPSGAVNHIHDVVFDPYRECFWILTGDFGSAAGLWRATIDWREVRPVFNGEQHYRATWMFVLPDQIYYGTDSQLEQNWLMRLTFSGSAHELERIRQIPGSSIYGARSGDEFFFSTTVEPPYPPRGRLQALTTRERGPGIRDECAYVYRLNPDGELEDVYAAAQDAWPLVPFQFATFRVCARTGGGAYITGQAVRGNDGRTRVLAPREVPAPA